MTPEKFSTFDSADYLKTDADIAAYLEAAAEGGDSKHFARALGTVARARNMSTLAKTTGMSREGLYKALSETGNPTLSTTLNVLTALGLQVSIKSAPAAHRSAKGRKTITAKARKPATKKSPNRTLVRA